ncbi:hypothetical protein BpHYR1_005757 [Brachionus plicatilis]|uniref:Uncharacterized protein n=1 Tax=Brachionus plicatilis TaxID=10195 RepID=A0A3M7R6Y8_BRAPC|nr:hypothetical protein BpHYR1_005757 [Brachionus plicatilis]
MKSSFEKIGTKSGFLIAKTILLVPYEKKDKYDIQVVKLIKYYEISYVFRLIYWKILVRFDLTRHESLPSKSTVPEPSSSTSLMIWSISSSAISGSRALKIIFKSDTSMTPMLFLSNTLKASLNSCSSSASLVFFVMSATNSSKSTVPEPSPSTASMHSASCSGFRLWPKFFMTVPNIEVGISPLPPLSKLFQVIGWIKHNLYTNTERMSTTGKAISSNQFFRFLIDLISSKDTRMQAESEHQSISVIGMFAFQNYDPRSKLLKMIWTKFTRKI